MIYSTGLKNKIINEYQDGTNSVLLAWRQSVFERDGWSCQRCEQVGGCRLEAHHILSFAEHISLRFDIDNGITLCLECHNAIHQKNKRREKDVS